MVTAAVSAIFIRDFTLANIQGYTLTHLFVPLTVLGLFKAFLRMVPVAEVLRLEASDKYMRVFTNDGSEVLLRTPLKELMRRIRASEPAPQRSARATGREPALCALVQSHVTQAKLKLIFHPT